MQPNADEFIVRCPDCGQTMRYLGNFIEGVNCVDAWHCAACDTEITRPCDERDEQ